MKKQFLILSLLSITVSSLYSSERFPGRSLTLGSAASMTILVSKKTSPQKVETASEATTTDDLFQKELDKRIQDAKECSCLPPIKEPQKPKIMLFPEKNHNIILKRLMQFAEKGTKDPLRLATSNDVLDADRSMKLLFAEGKLKEVLWFAELIREKDGVTNGQMLIENAAIRVAQEGLEQDAKAYAEALATMNETAKKSSESATRLLHFLEIAKSKQPKSTKNYTKTEQNIATTHKFLARCIVLEECLKKMQSVLDDDSLLLKSLSEQQDETAVLVDSPEKDTQEYAE